MVSVTRIIPKLNTYIRRPIVRNINPQELRLATDVFTSSARNRISLEEVKALFPRGRLEDNYIMESMNDLISRLSTPKKIIDLTPKLQQRDYEIITELMNMHNGQYIELWKQHSDGVENIQKLALFVRTLRLTKQAQDFLAFNPAQWETAVNGIITKPKDLIMPILEYKVDSSTINNALSGRIKMTPQIQQKVDAIERFLKLFKVKQEFEVYRGDKSFGILSSIKLPNGRTLAEEIEEFTKMIRTNYDENAVFDFIERNLAGIRLVQQRFCSTAMTKSATENYAKSIFWRIFVPKGIEGASIESFNVERSAEAEFLIQKGCKIKIKEAFYNIRNQIWEFNAMIEQPGIIDKPVNGARIDIGV